MEENPPVYFLDDNTIIIQDDPFLAQLLAQSGNIDLNVVNSPTMETLHPDQNSEQNESDANSPRIEPLLHQDQNPEQNESYASSPRNEILHQDQNSEQNESVANSPRIEPLHQEQNESDEETRQEKKLSRKRKKNIENWKSETRKRLRQSGEKYTDKRNKEHEARAFVYKECLKCPFKCSQKITEDEAKTIHQEFWNLSDDKKLNFYDKTTSRVLKKRVRKENQRSQRPRTYSFVFHFQVHNEKHRVCRDFYLKVLSISSRRIFYFHSQKKSGMTNTPKKDQRGKQTKIKVPEDTRRLIREHINSFPRVPGHYCRKNTKKEYLEFGLNLSKMYELYEEDCVTKNVVPAKKWLYSKIFNEEFNFAFYIPKKDQCDLCCEYENRRKYNTLTEELEDKYRVHVNEKEHARIEKTTDKTNLDENTALICFDLQRVLNIPQSNVSKAYYLQKLNVFNLTGCSVRDKAGYCILWHEGLSGRSGNEIASALVQMLKKFVEKHNTVKKVILWSDACVPQNRNSHMSTALLEFINDEHNGVLQIHQKFQEPGHSCVQEVDAIHSTIDKSLSRVEINSPLDLVRKLLKVKARNPYIIYQMKKQDFKNFQEVATSTNLKNVPYSKVKHIIYEKGSTVIKSRNSFTSEEFATVSILPVRKSMRKSDNSTEKNILPSVPKVVTAVKILSDDKIKCIKTLYPQFSPVDTQFWESLFSQNKRSETTSGERNVPEKKSTKKGPTKNTKKNLNFLKYMYFLMDNI